MNTDQGVKVYQNAMIAGNKNNLLSLDRKGMHKASIVSQATVMYDLGGSSGFKEEPIRSNEP